jgi:hypothetical protein
MKNFEIAMKWLQRAASSKKEAEYKGDIDRVEVGDIIHFQSAVGGWLYGKIIGIYPSGNFQVEANESGDIITKVVFRDPRFNVFYEYGTMPKI